MTKITIARIYITEAEKKLNPIMTYLHDVAKAKGVTVFRGISGFGASGVMHETRLTDLSLDLPLVIEFFDAPERCEEFIKYLSEIVEGDHIISWEGLSR